MDRSEMQARWDEALLKGWHDNTYIWVVHRRFLIELMLLGVDCPDPRDPKTGNFEFMDEINLLRCGKSRKTKNGVTLNYYYTKKPVRAFVAELLPWLSDRLWDDRFTDKELIAKMTAAHYTLEEPSKVARNEIAQKRRHKRQAKMKMLETYCAGNISETSKIGLKRSSSWGVVKAVRSRH